MMLGARNISGREFEARLAMAQENAMRPADMLHKDPTLRRCTDPVRWCRNGLGVDLWAKQEEIARSYATKPMTIVVSCHASGKSYAAAALAIWPTQVFDDAIVVTTAPTDRQVVKILWRYVHGLAEKSRLTIRGKLLKKELRVSSSCLAFGFTAAKDAGDHFQGIHSPRIFVIGDEASAFSEELLMAISAICTGDAHVLFTLNPMSPNCPVRRLIASGAANLITIPAWNTPNFERYGIKVQHIRDGSFESMCSKAQMLPGLIDPWWVRMMMDTYGEESVFFRTRVNAEFPDADSMGVINPGDIVSAQENISLYKDDDPIYLSLDPAALGGDHAVMWIKRGNWLRRVWRGERMNTMSVVGFVIQAVRALKLPRIDGIYVDMIGVGAGVGDRLAELGAPIIPVISSKPSSDSSIYGNLRAEMYMRCAEAFRAGELDIEEDAEVAEQLVSVRLRADKATSDGGAYIEEKKHIRARIGRSPDDADAIAQFWSDVERSSDFSQAGAFGGERAESYSPFTNNDWGGFYG